MVGCFFFLEAENETINDSSPDVLSQVGHYGQYGIVRHSGTRKFRNLNLVKSGSFDSPIFLYIPNKYGPPYLTATFYLTAFS